MLSGCSALTSLATSYVAGSSEPLVGVDTEVVDGDKTQGIDSSTSTKIESNEGVINSETSSQKTDIQGAETVNIDEGVPFWQATIAGIVLFLLGLFSPQLTINRKKL